jgi:acetyl-CoA C-acetyltransferase
MLDGDQIVLVAGVRTAVGRFGGGLKDVDAHVFAATCVREALSRAELEPEEATR